MHLKAWCSLHSDHEVTGLGDVFHSSAVWTGFPPAAHRVLEADSPAHGGGKDPEEQFLPISSHSYLKGTSAHGQNHTDVLETAGQRLPEDWVTSNPCPATDKSTRLPMPGDTPMLWKPFCVTWDRPEHLCTSPWQSERQTGILAHIHSQHSPTSASCSRTGLFCASLRVSKRHLQEHAHERETEFRIKTVVQELFSYDPSLIFASVNLQDTEKEILL